MERTRRAGRAPTATETASAHNAWRSTADWWGTYLDDYPTGTVAWEARLYRAMRHFWHPVLYASELGDSPKRAVLLEEPVVLVRLAGQVRCFADLCVHRSTALSLGWVEGDELRCAYHGWTYGSDGVCTRIPARFGSNIPRRARLRPYNVAEANGLIYVCLEEPHFPLPEFPQHY